jgi:cholesterol oxidase
LKDEVDAAWGPSITAGMDLSTPEFQMYLQDLGIPDPFFWFLEGAVPRGSTLGRAARLLKAYLLRMLGLGSQTAVSIGLEQLFEGSLVRSLPYLGMGADDADGSMRLMHDELDVVWPKAGSRRMFAAMEQALRAISLAAGGQYQPSPLWQWPLRKLLTAHPLGGCAMADDPQNGVVNEFGEAWNYPKLFVTDGSVIPTALSINPSATISALAERAAEHIASRPA